MRPTPPASMRLMKYFEILPHKYCEGKKWLVRKNNGFGGIYGDNKFWDLKNPIKIEFLISGIPIIM